MKTHERSLEVLLDIEPGLKNVGRDSEGVFLKHPESSGKNSVHVFYEFGLVHVFTDKFETLESGESYTTPQLIEQGLEQMPMDYADRNGWKVVQPSEKIGSTDLVDLMGKLKDVPPIKPLYAHFIERQAVTFLFGTAGTGKTFLAMDIANAMAGGAALPPFPEPDEPTESLYINFELNDMQLQRRYVREGMIKKLYRGVYMSTQNAMHIQWTAEYLDTYVRDQIGKHPSIGAVWIDNVTFLLENAADGVEAGQFIKVLGKIADERNVAVVVINHVPKINENAPLTSSSMSGSGKLRDGADYQLGLRRSMIERDHVLLMEVKTRHERSEYVYDQVPLYKIESVDGFVGLMYKHRTSEEQHIAHKASTKMGADLVRQANVEHVKRMRSLGVRVPDVAAYIGVSERTVKTYSTAPPSPKGAR